MMHFSEQSAKSVSKLKFLVLIQIRGHAIGQNSDKNITTPKKNNNNNKNVRLRQGCYLYPHPSRPIPKQRWYPKAVN